MTKLGKTKLISVEKHSMSGDVLKNTIGLVLKNTVCEVSQRLMYPRDWSEQRPIPNQGNKEKVWWRKAKCQGHALRNKGAKASSSPHF